MDSRVLIGEYLGYPKCCIAEFVDNFIPASLRSERVQQAIVNGFVPCPVHAEGLLTGVTTAEELINENRIALVPFKVNPTHAEDQALDQELMKLIAMHE